MQNNKLKIAVQMYGHLRTYEQCAPFLKHHLLDKYDCDVFIHTWDKLEHTTRSWYEDSVRGDPLAVNDTVIHNIHKMYAPKAIKIQTQDFIHEDGHFGTHQTIHITLKGLKYMLYSQHAANKLRLTYEQETGTSYDYVVVLRPDIMPLADLDFAHYQKEFDFYNRASIHLVHNSIIKLREDRFFNFPLVFDCFYFAKPEVITSITDCYLEFDRYFRDFPQTFPVGVENPECAICEYMTEKGITPRQYQFYFAIKRKNDNDDIKLIPPEMTKSLSTSNGLTYTRTPKQVAMEFIKLVLQTYVRMTPAWLKKLIRKPLTLIARLNEYLDVLEHRQDA